MTKVAMTKDVDVKKMNVPTVQTTSMPESFLILIRARRS